MTSQVSSTSATLPDPIATTSKIQPHPLDTSSSYLAAPASSSSPSSPTSPQAQEGSNSESNGITTPPVPMVHVRALIISGDSHVFSFEPETTVGRMKELIWSGWPAKWTEPAQPPSPSFLRILHAGRVLSDESTLSSNNLTASLTPNLPTVVHISVRSFSMRAEDADPKKPSLLHPVRSGHAQNEEEVGGCKCVIM